ncbi:hypothetical protein ACFPRL_12410 [Pseudoclavibacter helvolus]
MRCWPRSRPGPVRAHPVSCCTCTRTTRGLGAPMSGVGSSRRAPRFLIRSTVGSGKSRWSSGSERGDEERPCGLAPPP